MEIKLKNIQEILSDKLSLTEKGILITILLLKEDDPKMTLAKVKSKIKMSSVKKELIYLHVNNYIKWSGCKSAMKALEKERVTPDVINIIKFMNELYGEKFNPRLDSVNVNLINRLQNNSIDDIKIVIANRYAVWKDDVVMCAYLTPYTIFRPSKFDKYLVEARKTRKGEMFTNVTNIHLKNGDEITPEIVHTFIDTENYKIKTYRLNEDGRRLGNGMTGVRNGKAIKMSLKAQEKNVSKGEFKEFIYTYIAK